MFYLRKLLHITLGIILIMVGIAGLVLPILNGTLFLILGIILISFESTYVEEKTLYFVQKNKYAHTWYVKLERLLRKIFRK